MDLAREGREPERPVLAERRDGCISGYTGLAQRTPGSRNAQVRHYHEAVIAVVAHVRLYWGSCVQRSIALVKPMTPALAAE